MLMIVDHYHRSSPNRSSSFIIGFHQRCSHIISIILGFYDMSPSIIIDYHRPLLNMKDHHEIVLVIFMILDRHHKASPIILDHHWWSSITIDHNEWLWSSSSMISSHHRHLSWRIIDFLIAFISNSFAFTIRSILSYSILHNIHPFNFPICSTHMFPIHPYSHRILITGFIGHRHQCRRSGLDAAGPDRGIALA